MLMPILYAGLAGTVLALLVATRQQNWSLRVLFLLGLRLAIGWHFLFEGLHKLHTHEIGPSEYSRPFSSEMYFKVAPGPLGERMRSKFETDSEPLEAKLKGAKGDIPAAQFAKMPPQHQSAMCPPSVGDVIDDLFVKHMKEVIQAIEKDADADKEAADEAEAKAKAEADDFVKHAADGKWSEDEIAKIHSKADAERRAAKSEAEGLRDRARTRSQSMQELGRVLLERLKGMAALAQPLEKELATLASESAKQLQAIDEQEKKRIAEATATAERWLTGKLTADELTKARAKAEADKAAAKEKADEARALAKLKREKANVIPIDRKESTKRKYAMWAYGVTPRDTKIKGFAQDVPMTGPQRLAQIEFLRKRVTDEEERLKTGMGNGFGIDQKKAAEVRMELATAESDLRKDINSFVEELKKEFMGSAKLPAAEPPPPSEGQKMDQFTMWFLIAVGGCIMAGFLTRIACVAGCGFLVLTYLTHPPFPWFPLPPGTEGNPVFINKNVIEGLALLVLATFPTGRWLGIDALFACLFGCGRKTDTNA